MRNPTDFERRVWAEVRRIRWGQTKTYGQVADAIGSNALTTGTALSRLERFPDILPTIPWHRVTKLGPEGEHKLSINDRTREQVRLLLLEGHVIEVDRNHYRLK